MVPEPTWGPGSSTLWHLERKEEGPGFTVFD